MERITHGAVPFHASRSDDAEAEAEAAGTAKRFVAECSASACEDVRSTSKSSALMRRRSCQ